MALFLVYRQGLPLGTPLRSPSLYTLPVLVATGLGGTAALGATWLMIGPPLLVFLASQRHFYRGIAPGPLL
jgi:hypothetical protein